MHVWPPIASQAFAHFAPALLPGFGMLPIGQSSPTDLWRLVSLQDYNTRVVLLGTTCLGITAGLLGVYLLLRRRALIGDAIAHATLPGVALAFLWMASQGQDKSLPILLLGAALSGALGGASVLILRHLANIREDAALGIVLSVFFGGGVALVTLVQRYPGGNAAGLESFIYGRAASMTSEDVWLAVIVGGLVLSCILLVGKEFKILCFDAQLAQSQGWPVLLLDSLLIGLVVAVTIVGLRAVGLILMIALLVIPAASARFWTHQLPRMLLISALIGASSCFLGTLFSAAFQRLPSGATIVLVACVFFLLSLAFGRQRGLVWRITRLREMRRQHDFQHLLRAVYEILEARDALPGSPAELRSMAPIRLADVARQRSWSTSQTKSVAGRMAQANLVVLDAEEDLHLTPRGLLRAFESVRDHRLLEIYMMEQAEAGVSEADREADYLEHGLQPEHLAELSGVFDPGQGEPIPPSPHKIATEESDEAQPD